MSETKTEETFEASYEKLEKIVVKLESESLDLESTLKAFEEGNAIAEQCRKMLENAELKLKDLRETRDAELD